MKIIRAVNATDRFTRGDRFSIDGGFFFFGFVNFHGAIRAESRKYPAEINTRDVLLCVLREYKKKIFE